MTSLYKMILTLYIFTLQPLRFLPENISSSGQGSMPQGKANFFLSKVLVFGAHFHIAFSKHFQLLLGQHTAEQGQLCSPKILVPKSLASTLSSAKTMGSVHRRGQLLLTCFLVFSLKLDIFNCLHWLLQVHIGQHASEWSLFVCQKSWYLAQNHSLHITLHTQLYVWALRSLSMMPWWGSGSLCT